MKILDTFDRSIVDVKTTLQDSDIEGILKESWFKIVRRENTPLWESLIRIGATSSNAEHGFQNPMPHFFALDYDTYASTSEYEELKSIFIEHCKADSLFLDYFFANLEKDCTEIGNLVYDIQKLDLPSLSNRELSNWYKKFTNASLKILTYIWPPLAPEEWIIEHITNILSEKIDPLNNYAELQYALETLISSEKPSYIQQRQETILILATKIKNIHSSLSQTLMDEAYNKYAWIGDSSLRFSYESRADFNRDLEKAIQDHPERLLEDFRNTRMSLKNAKQKLIKKYSLSGEALLYIQQASDIPHWRLLRTEKIVEAHYYLQDFINEIASRLATKDMRPCYYWEVQQMLDGKEVNIARIHEREKGFGLLITESDIFDVDANTARRIKGKIQPKTKNNETIKGNTACRGYAKAKVRVIHSTQELGKLQVGEILVTSMTTPEYVPVMKKAAAIITDEGGISCHAAIISRELHIPCIIGTKIATQVLKDGDMVEVDADKGIVRKVT